MNFFPFFSSAFLHGKVFCAPVDPTTSDWQSRALSAGGFRPQASASAHWAGLWAACTPACSLREK